MARFFILLSCLLASWACAPVSSQVLAKGAGVSVWPDHRDQQPLSDRLMAKIKERKTTKESPILVRIFKKESELEIWKKDDTAHFTLLKTYTVCRWSGVLGPKRREGDGQSPEGFYAVTPDLLHPKSVRYLAINTGFPNALDLSRRRTGSFVMIHGGCDSVGCFAMGNKQMGEIYALARESFNGGQDSIQLQIYPFRMTARNMTQYQRSRHIGFWNMLKEGYGLFNRTKTELVVGVCEGRYTFGASTCPIVAH